METSLYIAQENNICGFLSPQIKSTDKNKGGLVKVAVALEKIVKCPKC